jgi:hypothetical protein
VVSRRIATWSLVAAALAAFYALVLAHLVH